MNDWCVLITSLPTENATARMRIWRALKSSGAAVLRDGVYLMPERPSGFETLTVQAEAVRASGGSAWVLRTGQPENAHFISLFDRREEYSMLLKEVVRLQNELIAELTQDVLKQTRKLRKAFASLSLIHFFPGEAQRQAETALSELELLIARRLSPDEPHPVQGQIPRLSINDYQGRIWATRRRPWVDRLACAWLIRRFIDPEATVLWLAAPSDCPEDALGFDFDAARFSHTDGRVTFEVLLLSFKLEQPALKRLAAVVHFLDVGGVQPPEAIGLESILAGLLQAIDSDDQLLAFASVVFDSLLLAFEKGVKTNESN